MLKITFGTIFYGAPLFWRQKRKVCTETAFFAVSRTCIFAFFRVCLPKDACPGQFRGEETDFEGLLHVRPQRRPLALPPDTSVKICVYLDMCSPVVHCGVVHALQASKAESNGTFLVYSMRLLRFARTVCVGNVSLLQ